MGAHPMAGGHGPSCGHPDYWVDGARGRRPSMEWPRAGHPRQPGAGVTGAQISGARRGPIRQTFGGQDPVRPDGGPGGDGDRRADFLGGIRWGRRCALGVCAEHSACEHAPSQLRKPPRHAIAMPFFRNTSPHCGTVWRAAFVLGPRLLPHPPIRGGGRRQRVLPALC